MAAINVAAAVFSMAVTVTEPVLLCLYVFKFRRLKFNLPDVLMGIIVCYFAQTVLFNLLMMGIQAVGGRGLFQDPVTQQVIYCAVGTATFLGGWYIVWAVVYRCKFSEGQVSRLTVGACGIKLVADILSAAWSNVSVAVRISNGTLEDLLTTTVDNPNIDAEALLVAYESYDLVQYLYLAILTVMLIQTTYLVLLQMAERRPVWVQLIVVAVFSLFYNYTLEIPVPEYVALAALAFSGVELAMIQQIMRAYLGRQQQ